MASIVIWLIGALFFLVGSWILLQRIESYLDWRNPHNISIGEITVDGLENKGSAELIRARFDHHFRRPASIPKETGFLEVMTLNVPDLFQPEVAVGQLKEMTIEVSGVDVTKLIRFIKDLVKPDQWIIEGDFQIHPDRALLALRLRRGQRLIRTWYLERPGKSSDEKSVLLEQLIDDAVFQLVYDFENKNEQDNDLRKWRGVFKTPDGFTSRAAVAAYYEARGALGQYYTNGDWKDLDRALDCLRTLRGKMPTFPEGLELLGMALAEKCENMEAIHVFEQLRLLLFREKKWEQLNPEEKHHLLSIDLLKAIATAKLYTWQSAHDAVAELYDVYHSLQAESDATLSKNERAVQTELMAHTAVQLSYTFALYLSYIRNFMVADIFGSPKAPEGLRITDSGQIQILRNPNSSADAAKRIICDIIRKIEKKHKEWLLEGEEKIKVLENQWSHLDDGKRRKSEIVSRLHLSSGYANYRMAELECHDNNQESAIFGDTFETFIKRASTELNLADETHPNNYLVLQLLSLVNSEPRIERNDLSIAEQYIERAILAKPSDFYSHELLAGLLLKRIANRGVDLASQDMIKKGFEEAQKAIDQREISGTAHLLRAEFQMMLLEIEKDDGQRQLLRVHLDQYINQAKRFLPSVFGRPNPDITWVQIVAATNRLGEEAEVDNSAQSKNGEIERRRIQIFGKAQEELIKNIDQLIDDCNTIERRWVAQQRVFYIKSLGESARRLKDAVKNATFAKRREIRIFGTNGFAP